MPQCRQCRCVYTHKGVTFLGPNSNIHWCSWVCYNLARANAVTEKCDECGKHLHKGPAYICETLTGGNYFRCEACYSVADPNEIPEVKCFRDRMVHVRINDNEMFFRCDSCNGYAPLERPVYFSLYNHGTYCSPVCSHNSHGKQDPESDKDLWGHLTKEPEQCQKKS